MKNLIPIAEGKALNTAEDVKDYFLSNGIAVNSWCRTNGHSRNVVKNLLNGRGTGARGKTHLAAIALGMKKAPQDSVPQSEGGEKDFEFSNTKPIENQQGCFSSSAALGGSGIFRGDGYI